MLNPKSKNFYWGEENKDKVEYAWVNHATEEFTKFVTKEKKKPDQEKKKEEREREERELFEGVLGFHVNNINVQEDPDQDSQVEKDDVGAWVIKNDTLEKQQELNKELGPTHWTWQAGTQKADGFWAYLKSTIPTKRVRHFARVREVQWKQYLHTTKSTDEPFRVFLKACASSREAHLQLKQKDDEEPRLPEVENKEDGPSKAQELANSKRHDNAAVDALKAQVETIARKQEEMEHKEQERALREQVREDVREALREIAERLPQGAFDRIPQQEEQKQEELSQPVIMSARQESELGHWESMKQEPSTEEYNVIVLDDIDPEPETKQEVKEEEIKVKEETRSEHSFDKAFDVDAMFDVQCPEEEPQLDALDNQHSTTSAAPQGEEGEEGEEENVRKRTAERKEDNPNKRRRKMLRTGKTGRTNKKTKMCDEKNDFDRDLGNWNWGERNWGKRKKKNMV